MIRQTRAELLLLWRGLVLPAVMVLVALLAAGNVVNSTQLVRNNYALFQHTRAEYAENGLDFKADLQRPPDVTSIEGSSDEVVGNLARYDYENLADSIRSLAPASSFAEMFKSLGFLVFPALFFLIGVWMATVQRRYRLEKVTLVRAGSPATLLGRQLALILASLLILGVAFVTDLVGRLIGRAFLGNEIALGTYPPLDAIPVADPVMQDLTVLLLILFFCLAGMAAGTIAGGFIVPALLFLVWDFVLPILGQHDPRNWFTVLGHEAFTFSSGFQLVMPIPLSPAVAWAATLVSTAVMALTPYLTVRLRNPQAV